MRGLLFVLLFLAGLFANPAGVSESAAREAGGTIIDMQPFRETHSIGIKGAAGQQGSATLINFNPGVNAWYLLRLSRPGASEQEIYHLENGDPTSRTTFPGRVQSVRVGDHFRERKVRVRPVGA